MRVPPPQRRGLARRRDEHGLALGEGLRAGLSHQGHGPFDGQKDTRAAPRDRQTSVGGHHGGDHELEVVHRRVVGAGARERYSGAGRTGGAAT